MHNLFRALQRQDTRWLYHNPLKQFGPRVWFSNHSGVLYGQNPVDLALIAHSSTDRSIS
jgi:hypothetical protein